MKKYEVTVCSICEAQAQVQRVGTDGRWSCPVHGDQITVKFVSVQPSSDSLSPKKVLDDFERVVKERELSLPEDQWGIVFHALQVSLAVDNE